jgi:hypothetical protein
VFPPGASASAPSAEHGTGVLACSAQTTSMLILLDIRHDNDESVRIVNIYRQSNCLLKVLDDERALCVCDMAGVGGRCVCMESGVASTDASWTILVHVGVSGWGLTLI